MARTRRIKTDGDAHYHLMSRTNDRRFLFEKGAIKTELVSVLRRTAEFCGVALKAEQDRLRARMNDISEFIKLFKEEFDRIYKRERKYCGSIWSGRFVSTLIQDDEHLARCMRYVVYNPIRAGMVTQAKDYRWSWCESESEDAVFAGAVPGEWCLRKVAQVGAGKVFGSAEFVMSTAFSLGDRFRAGASAHPVGEVGYSTHGWRLAKEVA